MKRKNTAKDKVLDLLNKFEGFRERKNRYRGILYLVAQKYPHIFAEYSGKDNPRQQEMIDAIIDFWTLNRWWNRLLQEDEKLRGKDYYDKHILRQEKQRELGYEFGYHQVKKQVTNAIQHDDEKENQKVSSSQGLDTEVCGERSEDSQNQLEERR